VAYRRHQRLFDEHLSRDYAAICVDCAVKWRDTLLGHRNPGGTQEQIFSAQRRWANEIVSQHWLEVFLVGTPERLQLFVERMDLEPPLRARLREALEPTKADAGPTTGVVQEQPATTADATGSPTPPEPLLPTSSPTTGVVLEQPATTVATALPTPPEPPAPTFDEGLHPPSGEPRVEDLKALIDAKIREVNEGATDSDGIEKINREGIANAAGYRNRTTVLKVQQGRASTTTIDAVRRVLKLNPDQVREAIRQYRKKRAPGR
jgi:hypothetical protein